MQNIRAVTQVCGHCGKSDLFDKSISFKRCGSCHSVHYCSVECQKADWKKHKVVDKKHAQVNNDIEQQTLARPKAAAVGAAFNRYVSAIQQPLRVALDSAFHAQEGDRSFIKDYYLSSTFVFNEDAPPADTTGRFTLLTIDRRERATAPPEYKEFLDNAASPNAVHLLSIVLSRGVGEGFANTFTLQPYRDLGYEAYPYCESWREAFMSELADPNPYGDALIPFMGRINRESPSQVERRRAERVLANRYPDADPRAELWLPQKYTADEIKEAERLGYGRALKR